MFDDGSGYYWVCICNGVTCPNGCICLWFCVAPTTFFLFSRELLRWTILYCIYLSS